jgi:hypothetical protein
MRMQGSQVQSSRALLRCCPQICPKNVPAGENLVIQERSVSPGGSAVSKKLHTTLESHLYKYLRFLISKVKFLVEETKENRVRKNKKIQIAFNPRPSANYL